MNHHEKLYQFILLANQNARKADGLSQSNGLTLALVLNFELK